MGLSFGRLGLSQAVILGSIMAKLTKKSIDAAKPGPSQTFLWDSELKGFGLLTMPSGIKSFVLQYRNAAGRSRRMTLGRYGALTVDQARALAADALAKVRGGADPMASRQRLRAAPTVSALLDKYLAEHVKVHNSARTAEEVTRLVEREIRPRLGRHKVEAVTKNDVSKLHRAMAKTPRQANFTLSILSKAFNLAEAWDMRPEHSNPARHVRRYKEAQRERFLNGEELAQLGQTLVLAEKEGLPWQIKVMGERAKHLAKTQRTKINANAIAAIRLLLFTGARLSEILELRWEHIDFEAGTIAFPPRKGDGRRAHPVGDVALSVLADLPTNEGSPFVLPSPGDPKKHLSKDLMEAVWQKVRHHAGIEDVRLHDLRHTVGTYAGQAGGNAFLIQHLLRHKNVAMTSRYVNPDADPIRSMSDAVSDRIAAGLKGDGQSAEVIPIKRR